jgi:phosphoglycerol transferase
MPGVTSLGDVLEDNNYHNVLYIGSDAEFANRKTYFKDHGDYDIDDYYRAQDQGLIPDDYYVWWGYEDAKLFEFAKDEVTYLADEAAKQASSDDADAGKPFNLTLLTTDTHFSNGYVCPDCVTDLPDQYSNVIRCSSKRVSEFIDWCKTQDWYDDTVIVLSGDHLYMDSSYYSDMPTGYQRKTYVSILNSSKEEPENERSFCTLDLFPTTLSAMGCTIDGDRLGLGTDAYSDTQTLTEQLGQDQFDYQLGLRSDYYNEKLIETK